MAYVRVAWALEFTLGGTHRYATEAVSIEGKPYADGLALPGGSVSQARDAMNSIPVQIVSGTPEGWAEIISGQGFELADGGEAVLSRVLIDEYGTQEALAYITGVVRGIEYGEDHEPLSFEIERTTRLAGTLIRPQAIMDESTSPDSGLGPSYALPEENEGTAYPLIIGYPGTFPNGVPKGVVPVRSPSWNNIGSRYLISDGVIDAAQVRLVNLSLNDSDTVSVISNEPDQLDAPVTLVASTLNTTGSIDDKCVVGFQNAAGWGGGLTYRGTVLRTLTDIFLWSLERSGERIDRGRVEAWRWFTDAYNFDTWIEDPTLNAWDFLDAAILPWAPVTIVESENGYWMAPLRMDATPTEARFTIDADLDPQIERTSKIGPWLAGGEVVNEVVVEYCLNHSGDTYYARTILTSQHQLVPHQHDVAVDERVVGHPRAKLSQAAYGVRRETISLPVVWDPATAFRIGADLLDRRALPRQAVSYRLPVTAETVAIEPGDVGMFADSRISMANRVVVVEEVTVGVDAVDVGLLLV